jgi:hypothetical protein
MCQINLMLYFLVEILNETMNFNFKEYVIFVSFKTWHHNEVLCLFILTVICTLLNVIGTSDGKFRRHIFEKM